MLPAKSTGPNLFKTSLLAWRANYLASKAAGKPAPLPAQPEAAAGASPSRPIRVRRATAHR